MQVIQRLWTFVFIHGLLFMASSAVFLIQQGGSLDNRLFILAVLLLSAGVIQGVIAWFKIRKLGWSSSWIGIILISLFDLALGGLILYAPDESLKVYTAIIAIWAAGMGLSLLFHFGAKKTFRASMTAAGISFLILGGYLFLFLDDAKSLSYQLIGILSLVFAVFQIYVAFQLKAIKPKEKSIDEVDADFIEDKAIEYKNNNLEQKETP